MADCEMLPKCPFFNDQMKDMPAVVDLYKSKYCREDNSECARYMVLKALGKEMVPPDLFPNMRDRAKEIIADNH